MTVSKINSISTDIIFSYKEQNLGHSNCRILEKGGKLMDTLALILSVVGCVNWGLVGIFQFGLVAWLFGGQGSLFSRIVYTLIGLAGLWCASFLFRRGNKVQMD